MKKLLALLLALLMVLSLCACDTEDDDDRDHSRFDRDDPTDPTLPEMDPVAKGMVGYFTVLNQGVAGDMVFHADGTCLIAGEDAIWTARRITEEDPWYMPGYDDYYAVLAVTWQNKKNSGGAEMFFLEPDFATYPIYGATGRVDTFSVMVDQIPDTDPMISQLAGSWTVADTQESEFPYSSVTLRADGTCTADGKDGTWTALRVQQRYIDFAYKEQYAMLSLRLRIDGLESAMTVQYAQPESPVLMTYSTTGVPTVWTRSGEQITVEITADNWQDYFEVLEYDDMDPNGNSYKRWSFQLKPQYQARNAQDTKLQFEFTFRRGYANCEIGDSYDSIDLTGAPYDLHNESKRTELYVHQAYELASSLFCNNQIEYYSDFDVLRVAGDTKLDLIRIVTADASSHYTKITVESDSVYPALKPGQIRFAKEIEPAELNLNDVVAFYCTVNGMQRVELGVVSQIDQDSDAVTVQTVNSTLVGNGQDLIGVIINQDSSHLQLEPELLESAPDAGITLVSIGSAALEPTVQSGQLYYATKTAPAELALDDLIVYWTAIDGQLVAEAAWINWITTAEDGTLIFETRDAQYQILPLTVHEASVVGKLVLD